MEILFFIVPIFIGCMFIFTFGMIFSPKLRSKFMGHQLKMQKRMLEDNKDVIQDLGKLTGEIGVKTTKGIMDENEDDLRHISSKGADIASDGITKTVRAIKKGMSDAGDVYCKHCGESIDSDSTFCKACGKKQ